MELTAQRFSLLLLYFFIFYETDLSQSVLSVCLSFFLSLSVLSWKIKTQLESEASRESRMKEGSKRNGESKYQTRELISALENFISFFQNILLLY